MRGRKEKQKMREIKKKRAIALKEQGLTPGVIAQRLGISVATVNTYLRETNSTNRE